MNAKAVEWILVVRYGSSAHRATYGRLSGSSKYTKDYIQLYRSKGFLDDLNAAFPGLAGAGALGLTYKWPSGSAEGKLLERSADRPHLAWETNRAPPPWRMLLNPSVSSVETIKGNPSHSNEADADAEYDGLLSSGFGQPFLIAIKLRDESDALHLRVLIENPEAAFNWASLGNAPTTIQELAAETSDQTALAWKLFPANEMPTLYFDTSSKIAPWHNAPVAVPTASEGASGGSQGHFDSQTIVDSDFVAETLLPSDEEVSALESHLNSGNYEVPDSTATVKTRGSAQRVFANAVKGNYGWKCALTGISSKEFLIASHIVPWSADEKIRLDPSNGICLSVLADRAFEYSYLIIHDDSTVEVNWKKIGDDSELRTQLAAYDGAKLNSPKSHPPKIEYLNRRRNL
ncbi:MAG: HNH endonuclease [Sphingomonadales bacterium]|nr:HNH endonuclease [Sphingomonadaceae bacterium]MBS3930467.1 HNH endonuclease [Sphingomonadales bacterium]